MGHEIAHAVARHGDERMSQGLLVQTGGIALSAALAKQLGNNTPALDDRLRGGFLRGGHPAVQPPA